MGVCLALALDEVCLCASFGLILQRVCLLLDLRVQLALLDGDLLLLQLRLLFAAGDVGVGLCHLDGLTLLLLLYGIRGVCLCALRIGAHLHLCLLNGEGGVLLCDLLLRLDLHGVRLLLCLGGRDGNIPLGVRLCYLGVLPDLLHVVDTHILDGTCAVLEVLDIEVDYLDAQLFHIGHHVLGDLLRYALTVLHHFLQTHRAHDLAHITLQHLGHQSDHLLTALSQQRLCRSLEQLGVGGNLDVCHTVHRYVDELVGGDCLRGLDVHLHYAERELIHTLEEGYSEACSTYENTALSKTRNDVRGIRRRLQVAEGQKQCAEQHHSDCDDNDCRCHKSSPFL